MSVYVCFCDQNERAVQEGWSYRPCPQLLQCIVKAISVGLPFCYLGGELAHNFQLSKSNTMRQTMHCNAIALPQTLAAKTCTQNVKP